MVEADHYIKPNQVPPCAESIALERKGNGESELAVTVPCLGIKSYFSVVETGVWNCSNWPGTHDPPASTP